jgi:WD40 repeat protein
MSPPALHLLSTDTFQPLADSPLLDVPSMPVFDLSASRCLAYASTSSLPSKQSGILASNGKWESVAESGSPTSPSTERRSISQGEVAQAARRVVTSGVKAIGDLGVAYWNSRTQPQDTYSRSAPGSSSPTEHRTLAGPRHDGHVRVLDLATMRTTAHFRPTESSVALLSFDPSGGMLLTGSSEARAFHVFELRGAGEGRVWHRYDLSRGMTYARAAAASWSDDGRLVAISTARGTARASAHACHFFVDEWTEPRRCVCRATRRRRPQARTALRRGCTQP